ncbi:similar to Saccharomyces cerevisiae YLR051C FCF2 Essential nucleolar protein involved in the early steps of 35S rRNA processing [Maudiozyma barnettii]|uniref:Similar to Saccharomyces cerevisiae YLR051C FCF2 Essential nucleolar protein involved in the early steps of 35S rRNA processing n=1 Tax=Maudiozyma barnettii TaxID=61262 RepID=A0A8H2VEN0_9SACH|nr:Fcf2p [Kazachstania barnettii]CAB4254131.1 similar to Saccharomyces cerevisiae YLR051C FCF2 Essential nucleolar protein involved in the early steps of 35S rRNA processing [Kazachstania barnettii]CAD1781881.1 similar to Saccharomyces cerevisiae YLR051C FCF2 Essential nucleolar protein involved in the early steps of 35S rRNA processing [Kazachstania barnettii]
MDSNMDDLFNALKESVTKESTPTTVDTTNQVDNDLDANDNIVGLDGDKRDTEKIFRDIEITMNKLPKLDNGFDSLVKTKTVIPNDKSSTVKSKMVQKEKTQDDWFTIPKPSDSKRKELQRDLTLIKHRAALDPKRHYKKDRWVVPERFSVGTIVESKGEFYSSRIKNKDRKSTILESLMGDDTGKKYFKRKFTEIQDQKSSGRRGHYNKSKAMRKRY